MKRILAILLTLTLIFAFAGCKKGKNSSDMYEYEKIIISDELPEEVIQPSDESGDKNMDKTQGSTSNNEGTDNHTHTYTAATCTAPKTCSICGKTSGSPLGHQMSNGVCSVCGYDENAEKCQHSFTGASIFSEICTKCGEPRKAIKVLAIGNSYSEGATRNLWNILKGAGFENVIVGNLRISSCTVDQHLSYGRNDDPIYKYQKNTSGTWENTENTKMSTGLADEKWDVVVLQQASHESGQPDRYGSVKSLYELVKGRVPSSAKFYWHMTWAYKNDGKHAEFGRYNNSQIEMYNAICSTVQSKIVPLGIFNGIFPVGTAIQNLRNTHYGDNLTSDEYSHLNDVGKYTAALTWFAALGGNVDSVTWAGSIGESNLPTIKQAVKNAITTPYSVS